MYGILANSDVDSGHLLSQFYGKLSLETLTKNNLVNIRSFDRVQLHVGTLCKCTLGCTASLV